MTEVTWAELLPSPSTLLQNPDWAVKGSEQFSIYLDMLSDFPYFPHYFFFYYEGRGMRGKWEKKRVGLSGEKIGVFRKKVLMFCLMCIIYPEKLIRK